MAINASNMTQFEKILMEGAPERWAQYRRLVDTVINVLPYQQDHFDTHSAEHHIRQVLHNVDMLVPDDQKAAWSLIDVFLLLCSIWLHDVGKLEDYDASLSFKEIRSRHADRSYEFIVKLNEKLSLDEKEALIIAYIVKGHTLSDLGELPEKKGLGIGQAVTIRPLAALLRLADELDMDYRRVPDVVKRLSKIQSNQKWTVRESIDGLEINNSVWDIIIYSTPKTFDSLDALNRTVSLVNEALDSIWVYLRDLRLFYRKIDHVIDDTYLRELEKDTHEKEAKKEHEPLENKRGEAIGELVCQFTSSVCKLPAQNTNMKMVFVGMPFSEDFEDVYRFAIQPVLHLTTYILYFFDRDLRLSILALCIL
jgi:hypothetical protein